MIRQRTIVGIGEAMLAEGAERDEPAGIAASIPIHAVNLGHKGVVISRLGQDNDGQRLLVLLNQASIDTSYLQWDPDLATGRVIVRSITGIKPNQDEQAAFDRIQWDFDLANIAQRADAVVFGIHARRGGQTRSVIDQFLNECRGTLKILDLAHASRDKLQAGQARAALEQADVVIVDEFSLSVMAPGSSGESTAEHAQRLSKTAHLGMVLLLLPDESVVLATPDAVENSSELMNPIGKDAAIVTLIHGLLAGWPARRCLKTAIRVANHTATHESGPIPAELLEER